MQLLQHVVDKRASSDPDGIAYIIPKAEKNVDEGFEEISCSRFANAVNRATSWLRENVKGSRGQTLAFISPQDIRYLVFILAANKAGHKLLLLSPRNSDEAQKHLLGVAGCQYFLYGKQFEASSRRVAETMKGRVEALLIPDLWSVLSENKVEPIEFTTTWDEARHTPFVVLHTSGTSTGKPKPIVLNHGYYAIEELLARFPRIDGRALRMKLYTPGIRICFAMPLFHVGALFATLFKPLLQEATVVLLPGDTQLEADLVIKALSKTNSHRLSTSPTIIENLMARPDGREVLAKLEQVAFGSGPMSIDVGDALFKLNPRSTNMYGATEMCLLPILESDDPEREWQYCYFHPWTGAYFDPISGDEEMCELVIRRFPHPAFEALQPAFENWPNAEEYRSKDVFVRHPTKKDLWKWYSRTDDVITFETGEKLNPSTMESIIAAHPKVGSAVIIGQRRMQPALLIEPVEHVSNHKALLDELWPTIQRANMEAPSYGQLVKQLVLFSEEAFKRTPKGTVQRTKTEEFLAQEIANLYEGGGESVYSTPSDLTSQDSVQEFVHTIVHDILDLPQDFSEDANLFDAGLDSLKAAELVRASNVVLKKYLTNGHAPPRIDVSTVYSDPSIQNLSSTIFKLANHRGDATEANSWPESAKRLLSRHVPVLATGAAILTGSTGSLGKHLLHLLLHDETYSHVYCLNRSDGARKGFVDTFPSDNRLLHKVTFLQTSSIWSSHFGLPGEVIYRELLSSVRTVFHNAWPVNFLMAVEATNPSSYSSSFEPQLDGVANLLRFCAESTHKARFVYVSSLSSVMSSSQRPVPEDVVTDPSAPGVGGYPRSKWATECIMDAVARQNPGTVSQPIVIRPGQICGPLEQSVEKGASGVGATWNAREAISSIFISSATIGALPSCIGHEEKLRWVPVDIVAKTTLEIVAHVDRMIPAGAVNREGASAWNVINIQPEEQEVTLGADGKKTKGGVTWNSMLPTIQARLEKRFPGKEFPVVTMAEWIERVEAYGSGAGAGAGAGAATGSKATLNGTNGINGVNGHGNNNSNNDNSKRNPAIKLQEFMGSLACSTADDGLGTDIATQLTKEASRSLREMGPVKETWIEYWMEGWGL